MTTYPGKTSERLTPSQPDVLLSGYLNLKVKTRISAVVLLLQESFQVPANVEVSCLLGFHHVENHDANGGVERLWRSCAKPCFVSLCTCQPGQQHVTRGAPTALSKQI